MMTGVYRGTQGVGGALWQPIRRDSGRTSVTFLTLAPPIQIELKSAI